MSSAPITLSGLSVREAISDALYRIIWGIDTDDYALFESGFTDDAAFDLNGNVMRGKDAIRSGCFDVVSKMDTTHFLTNIRIDVKDGESKAYVTTSALAQHYRAGQGKEPNATRFLAGSLYFLDLIKDENGGLWKVTHWKLTGLWTEGDAGVMSGN